jgi:hypothetical protein
MNEIMLGSLPVVLILLWLSRAAEVVMVVGLVVYSVKLFTARSAAKRP